LGLQAIARPLVTSAREPWRAVRRRARVSHLQDMVKESLKVLGQRMCRIEKETATRGRVLSVFESCGSLHLGEKGREGAGV
jgi:hypothetical protein